MNPDLLLSVNGKPQRLPADTTVGALLERMDLAGKRLAVEVNDSIVPRSLHGSTLLAEGDRVEIVIAVGGG